MSLATRCTSCGTIFRVVQDQLKVSEGWVRCGRCQHVFNALQCLFDLERDAPPPWPAAGDFERTQPVPKSTARQAVSSLSNVERDTPDERAFERTVAPPADDEEPFSTQPLLRTQSRESEPEPSAVEKAAADEARDGSTPDSDFADARFNPDLLDPDEGSATVAPRAPAATAATVAIPATGLAASVTSASIPAASPSSAGTEATPSPAHVPSRPAAIALPQLVDEPPRFIREAERAERWRRAPVRLALASLAALLTLLLLLQLALHFRAWTVTHWPASRDVVATLCQWASCGPLVPRDLEALTVTSTGLVRADAPGDYRLTVTLQNRSSLAVMVPAVELAVTDAQGRLLSRRALQPQELTTQTAVPAEGELTLQAQLRTGDQRVVGYSVEIFYP